MIDLCNKKRFYNVWNEQYFLSENNYIFSNKIILKCMVSYFMYEMKMWMNIVVIGTYHKINSSKWKKNVYFHDYLHILFGRTICIKNFVWKNPKNINHSVIFTIRF